MSRDHFDAVLFSPNKLLKDKKVGSDQSNFTIDPESEEKKAVELKNIWIRLKDAKEADVTGPDHSSRWTTAAPRHQIVHSFTCLTEAVDWVQQFARTHENDTHVLVTGSLHLVGGVLGLIDPDGQCFKSEERA